MVNIIDTSPQSLKVITDTLNQLLNMAYDNNGAALRDGSVTTPIIADNAVTGTKIIYNAISVPHIEDSAIISSKIAAEAVTGDEYDDLGNFVKAGKLSANAIYARNIAANQILAEHISAGAITSDAIAANSITAQKLAADSVTANAILAGIITADKIAANTITADKIAANTITADKIAANQLVVGVNVTMGSNATISWTQVTNQPTIPTTAAQVGARPDTWLPTATQVGARPNDWVPTASQVGALATTWVGTTYINGSGLYTGTIVGNQIYGGTITGVTISGVTLTGSTVTTTQSSNGYIKMQNNAMYFYNQSGSQLGSITCTAGMYLDIVTNNIVDCGNVVAHHGILSDGSITSSGSINATGYVYAGDFKFNNGYWNVCFSHWITEIEVPTSTTASFYCPSNGTTYYCTVWASDKTLKDNIQDTKLTALDKIMKIHHVEFDWKNGEGHIPIGYISQELQEIEPNFVFEAKQVDKPSLYQPAVNIIVPMITKAIQEMQNEIDYLKSKIA